MKHLDRSRWKRRWHCNRAAFYEYDYGGWGLRPKAQSIPLATGNGVHGPLAEMLGLMQQQSGPLPRPTLAEVREIIAKTLTAYKRDCAATGFMEEDTEGQTAYVIAEQAHLIECLIWAVYRCFLPWLHENFEILQVEHERDYVIGCTCGLGDGIGLPADHEARVGGNLSGSPSVPEEIPCQGTDLMLRPDFVTRRRHDGSVGIWDWKTGAYDLRQDDHEHSVQLGMGSLGVEAELGEPVSYYYLAGMKKGKREASKAEGASPLKLQQTVFCYDYCLPANPPFTRETQWNFGYTTRKGYGKVPVWQAHFPAKPVSVGQPGDQGVSTAEWWVMHVLPEEVVQKQLSIVGPCELPRELLKKLPAALAQQEREWQQRLQWLEPTDAEPFPADIDLIIPQSWNCKQYFGRSCEFMPICYKEPGHENPGGMAQYITRRPHHQAELEAAVAAGVKWEGVEEAPEE